MIETITLPSLIAGIFRELGVLNYPVTLSHGSTSFTTYVQLLGPAKKQTSSSNMLDFLPRPVGVHTATIRFELGGQYYEGITEFRADYGTFTLPENLQILKRRRSSRSAHSAISKLPIVALLSGLSTRLFGTLKDFDSQHIVVSTQGHECPFSPNDAVQLHLFSGSQELLQLDASVSLVRSPSPDHYDIIVARVPKEQLSTNQRHPRLSLTRNVSLSLCWPDDSGLKLDLEVIDVAIHGFSASFSSKEKELPPVGALCMLEPLHLRARVVWCGENRLGLDLSLNPRFRLNKWLAHIERWTRDSLASLPKLRIQKQILSLMLRSGYLAGKRTTPFSKNAPVEQLIPVDSEAGQWLIRVSDSHSSEDVNSHVSFVRMSDQSWLIQELGHSANAKGLGSKILDSAVADFAAREHIYNRPNSVLFALYDPTSSFNQSYWERRRYFPHTYHTEAAVLDLAAIRTNYGKPEHSSSRIVLTRPDAKSWLGLQNMLAQHFNRRLLYGLGLGTDSFASEILKEQLASSGFSFSRQVLIAQIDDKAVGALVRLGLPPFSNLTGLTDALFLCLTDRLSLTDIFSSLRRSDHEGRFLAGATDAILFSSTPQLELPTPEAFAPRRFLAQFIEQAFLPEFVRLNGERP